MTDRHKSKSPDVRLLNLLERMLKQRQHLLSPEVTVFLNHYLEILKDATGMSDELNEMETLARQLYRDHKKVLDFVVEHGASTDFAIAARTHFGDNPVRLAEFQIGKGRYVFSGLGNNIVSLLPTNWYEAFGETTYEWPGCENWWAGYPLIAWFQLFSNNDGQKGQLRLHAEVGPYKFRNELIDSIQGVSRDKGLSRIRFQKGAANEGKKYSKFLKENTIEIKDIHDPDEISTAMTKLLDRFQPEFEAIAEVLPPFLKNGDSSK